MSLIENQEQDLSPKPNEQQELFGLDIVEWTNSGTETAHLKSFAIASDGMEYAVKRVIDGQESQLKVKQPLLIPASEFLCYKLAEKCGISTPQCRLLLDKENGEYVFGSQIETGAIGANQNCANLFITKLKEGNPHFIKQLWAIYAFDQFIYNVDRHINNYLYTQSRHATTVKAFDFSLSSLVLGWPADTDLLPDGCNTIGVRKIIVEINGSDLNFKAAAYSILDKLERITPEHLQLIIAEIPEGWIGEPVVHKLLSWWKSDGRINRIRRIREEIENDEI